MVTVFQEKLKKYTQELMYVRTEAREAQALRGVL